MATNSLIPVAVLSAVEKPTSTTLVSVPVSTETVNVTLLALSSIEYDGDVNPIVTAAYKYTHRE